MSHRIFFALGALMICASTACAQSGWTIQSSKFEQYAMDIAFGDSLHGMVVGLYGTVRSTSDGGTTWVDRVAGETHDINSVAYSNAHTVLIAGLGGVFLRSTDDGSSWTNVITDKGRRISSIAFADSQHGVALNFETGIVRTSDGGQTWITALDSLGIWLTKVAFANDSVCVCVSNGAIFRSSNQGVTWTTISDSMGDLINDVAFADKERGVAVGNNGLILFTSDAGLTWKVDTAKTTSKFYSVGFVNRDVGIIVGTKNYADQIVDGVTTDGGQTWSMIPVAAIDPRHVCCLRDGRCFLVGGSGQIARCKFPGEPWSYIPMDPVPDLRGCAIVDSQQVTVVGDRGVILTSTNAGALWYHQRTCTLHNLNAVVYANDSTGVAVGDSGYISRTTNSGAMAAWRPVNSGTTHTLLAASLRDSQHLVAVGELGTMIISTDGGALWNPRSIGTLATLRSICYVNPLIGVIVADSGKVFQTRDGGSTWTSARLGTNVVLHAAAFLTESVRLVVGDSGVIFRSSDDGISWDRVYRGITRNILSVSVIDSRTALVAGARGFMARTSDGGVTWQALNDLVGCNIRSIASSSSKGYAVGDSGIILFSQSFGTYLFWENESKHPEFEDLYAVKYFSAKDIGALTEYSAMVRSTDAGGNWWKQSGHQTIKIHAYGIFDSLTMVVIDDNGQFQRTSDGGMHWINVFGFTSAILHGMSVLDSLTAFAVGDAGSLIRTTDAGRSWTVLHGIPAWMNDICFISADTGFAAANGGFVVRTTDGGKTGTSLPTGITTDIRHVCFIDSKIGFVTGAAREFLRTTDGGLSWKTPAPPPGSVFGFYVFRPNLVFMYGSNLIASSVDSGKTWQVTNTDPVIYYGLAFLNDSVGTAVGTNGTIVQTSDGGRSWFSRIRRNNSSINDVAYASFDTGCAVGVFMQRTTDAGKHWTLGGNGATHLNSICFSSGTKGYAVGPYGEILRTQDAGYTWTTLNVADSLGLTGEMRTFNAVASPDSGTCVIGGGSSIVLQSHDNGNTWSWQLVDSNHWQINRVVFVTPEIGYVVCVSHLWQNGANGELLPVVSYVTSDGGASWSPWNKMNGQCLDFLDARRGVFVYNEQILKDRINYSTYYAFSIFLTADSGNTWHQTYNSPGGFRNAVRYVDSITIVAVGGDSQQVVLTTNGGKSWLAQEPVKGENLYGLYGYQDRGATAVGTNNTIIRLFENPASNPLLHLSCDSMAFGRRAVGSINADSVSVVNNTGERVEYRLHLLSNPSYTITPISVWVDSGNSATFHITFQPRTGAPQNAVAVFADDIFGNHDTLIISGEGAGCRMSLSEALLNFGSNAIGVPVAESLEVRNVGAAPLHIDSIVCANSEFSTRISTATINAGEATSLRVTFAPDSLKTFWSMLQIFSDAPTSPDTVRLIADVVSNIGEITAFPDRGSLLFQSYPNPLIRNRAQIAYILPRSQHIALRVYSIVGKEIATIENTNQSAGFHSISFDAARLPKGVYVYRLEGLNTSVSRMFVIQ